MQGEETEIPGLRRADLRVDRSPPEGERRAGDPLAEHLPKLRRELRGDDEPDLQVDPPSLQGVQAGPRGNGGGRGLVGGIHGENLGGLPQADAGDLDADRPARAAST